MKLSDFSSLQREFDFRLAGRWLFLGSIVGIISGLGAILFQTLLVHVKEFTVSHLMGLEPVIPGGEKQVLHYTLSNFNPYFLVLIPALGGLLAGFIVYKFAPEAEGHGTDEAINAFHRKRGIIRPLVPIVKLVASVITIGTGGSGGREGPIAQIGAGFGSFLGTTLKLDAKTRRWLLAAGMGAGIGSIFRAPLAGAIFAAEVLYSSAEVESEVLLPAAVSSIIAYSVYSFKYGWEHIFTNAGQFGFSDPLELIPYTIEAVMLAFAALVFVKSFYGIRKIFTKWKISNYLKPVIGGLVTGTLALVLILITGDKKYVIDVMGSGYGILQEIFQNNITNIGIGILIIVAFGKIITTSFTIGSGGSAGVFGPSMVIGGTLGAASGYLLQFIFPGINIYPSTFAIVGMAGFFAAAANTPLSTIIMVSELTGNYELLMPSMWVCALSYLMARRWSIYKNQVPGKAQSHAHFGEYAYDILESILVDDAINKKRKVYSINSNMVTDEIILFIRDKHQHVYPVVDTDKQPIGTIQTDTIQQILLEPDNQNKTAKEIMHRIVLKVRPDETIETARQIMQANNIDELIVLDDNHKPSKILGLLTFKDIMIVYNRKLTQLEFNNQTANQ